MLHAQLHHSQNVLPIPPPLLYYWLQKCGLFSGRAEDMEAEQAEARQWIKDALLMRQPASATNPQGSVPSRGVAAGDTAGPHPPAASASAVAPATVFKAAVVVRAQVLQVAMMATGMAAASAEQLHAVLLSWLQVRMTLQTIGAHCICSPHLICSPP